MWFNFVSCLFEPAYNDDRTLKLWCTNILMTQARLRLLKEKINMNKCESAWECLGLLLQDLLSSRNERGGRVVSVSVCNFMFFNR